MLLLLKLQIQLWTNLALVNRDWCEAVSDKPVSLRFPGSPPSDAKQWLSHRSRVHISGLSFLPDEVSPLSEQCLCVAAKEAS